jgi:hypothetical protein
VTPPERSGNRSRLTCASFWIDESYTRTATGACIVMAGIKTRVADDLQREIHAIRDKHQHYRPHRELKFTKLSQGNWPVFRDIVDALEASDARLVATVTDLRANNPFSGGKVEWRAHAELASRLVAGNINQGERAVAYLDLLTTPPGKSLGTAVKRKVNARVGSQVLLDAVSLDSKANDLLQVADAIAGAIRYERDGTTSHEFKTKFVRRLAAAFELTDFQDVRTRRVNILTMRDRSPLRLVQSHTDAS